VLSVEVPMATATPPERRVRKIFDATQTLLTSCRSRHSR
jgi:hypothetical protein